MGANGGRSIHADTWALVLFLKDLLVAITLHLTLPCANTVGASPTTAMNAMIAAFIILHIRKRLRWPWGVGHLQWLSGNNVGATM